MIDFEHVPRPEAWDAVNPRGQGSCFHRALSRWAHLRAEGDTHWKIAVAVVCPEVGGKDRHVHAWLQAGECCLLHDGAVVEREPYYEFMGVERRTVRLVNPRGILRSLRARIDRTTIDALLALWGLPYKANDQGGVIPA